MTGPALQPQEAASSGQAEFTPWSHAYSEGGDWVVWGAVSEPDATGMTYQPAICTLSDSCGEEEARLIASAPDGLAFAMALDASWTEAFPGGPDETDFGVIRMGEEHVALWRQCRAFILKATTAASDKLGGDEPSSASAPKQSPDTPMGEGT